MNIFQRVKAFLNTRENIKKGNLAQDKRIKHFIRAERLNDSIYHCQRMGISAAPYCDHEVIVSLTTYGKRLYDVATTIESIMQGSMLPNRLILWLEEGLKDTELPFSLQCQQERGLQIEYCKDLRSYKKLIPAMKAYPDAIIVTLDDDLLYESDLLENLLRSYKQHPTSISASRIHTIVLGPDHRPILYKDWKLCQWSDEASPLNFFTSGGGTLFPPHCFDEEVFNEEVFMSICQCADDIWFNAMALKRGTPVVKSFTHSNRGEDYTINNNVQDVGLTNINNYDRHLNDTQLKAVFEQYELYPLFEDIKPFYKQ